MKRSQSINIVSACLLGLLLPGLYAAQAQTRYKPVKKVTGSTTDFKAMQRDLTTYPLTSAGNTAFNSAVAANSLPVVDRPIAGAVVGKYSYDFALSGSDYNGHPFVTTTAPVLVDAPRSAPRPLGNYFPLDPQTAQNTVLLRRLPTTTVPSSKIVVYAGPNFTNTDDRSAILTRGFNAVAENVQDRTTITGTRGNYLIQGNGYRAIGGSLANNFGISMSTEARNALRDYADHGYYINNAEAGLLFGQAVWNDKKGPDWSTNSNGAFAFSPDFEDLTSAGGYDEAQWRNMVGYMMAGVKSQANADGKPTPWFLPYDWGTLTNYSLQTRSRDQGTSPYTELPSPIAYDPEPGVPFYFSYAAIGGAFGGGTKLAPIGANNPLAQYAKANPSAAGSVEYMRNTWDDQTFFKKNGNGQPLTRTVSGSSVPLLVYRDDARTATIYGQSTDILGLGQYGGSEATNFIYLTYERIQQAITDLYFRAGGKHLPMSTDRQAGWENLKLEQWFRFDTEFKNEEQAVGPHGDLNSRPLNPDFVEGDAIAHYLLRDVLRTWGASEPTLTQGQLGTTSLGNGVGGKGSVETFSKAIERASQLNFLTDTPWRLVCPRYLIRNQAEGWSWYDPNEAFEKKPIVFGGIVPSYGSKSYLWMYWRYPMQDVDQSTEMVCWVDKGSGPVTGAYRLVLRGRKTGLDYWEVPAAVATAEPQHIKFQFTDLTGVKQTWTGDYRIPVQYTNHPTPPTPVSITGDIYKEN
ncbi:hypothetical protein [Spirosoma jeollabukense]